MSTFRVFPIGKTFKASLSTPIPRLCHCNPQHLLRKANIIVSWRHPPKLHYLRCHRGYFEFENPDTACPIPHDDDSAIIERVGLTRVQMRGTRSSGGVVQRLSMVMEVWDLQMDGVIGCAYGSLFSLLFCLFYICSRFYTFFLFYYLLTFFSQKNNYRLTPNVPDFAPTPLLKMTNSHPASRCGAISRPSHSAAAVLPPRGSETDTLRRTQKMARRAREELEPIIQVSEDSTSWIYVRTQRRGQDVALSRFASSNSSLPQPNSFPLVNTQCLGLPSTFSLLVCAQYRPHLSIIDTSC